MVDVDTGEIVLEVPPAGWSTIEVRDDHVVFGLDGLRYDDGDRSEVAPDQRMGVWEVASRRMVFDRTAHLGAHPSPTVVAGFVTVAADEDASAWNLTDGQIITETRHPGLASPVAAHGDRVAIIARDDARAEVRLVDRKGRPGGRTGACGPARAVAFSPDGALLAVAGDRRLCALRVPSLSTAWSRELPAADERGRPRFLWFAADGSLVLVTEGSEGSLFAEGGERRSLSKEETEALFDARRPAPSPARRHASEVAKRLGASLCLVHGCAFPAALCGSGGSR